MRLKSYLAIAILLFLPPLFPIYVLYLLFLDPSRTGERIIPTLILLEAKVGKSDDQDSPLLEMSGRYPGLIARIMKWIGLASISHLEVTHEEVRVSLSSISGVTHFNAPLGDIRATDVRSEKPVWQLYIGLLIIAFLLLNIVSSFTSVNPTFVIVLAVIALLFIFSYIRSTRLVVAFTTANLSQRYGLAFDPKGQLSYEFLSLTMRTINQKIADAHFSKNKPKRKEKTWLNQ